LLISSYFFYGYWDYRFLILIIISTLVDFYVGNKINNYSSKSVRKKLLFVSVITNLSILGFFKYFNFFVDSFETLISTFNYSLDFLHINIILPVGISFYTFQTMSYTIDVYRDKIKPTNNILDFAVFVSFFPQLVAGPIERAKNLLPQINSSPLADKKQILQGLTLVVLGLFKKVLIGDPTGKIVDNVFLNPEIYKSFELIAALVLFSIQIYADFSGYTNIARGTAKLLGFNLIKNFEQPYFSRNITEFWRRWHISLSAWLKDYLYISLGGNRKGVKLTYVNLMITMLLGGLWHGASWNFVIWGGLHGLYLSVHKFFLRGRKIKDQNFDFKSFSTILKFIIKVLFTYTLVLFAWLFFRAESLDKSISIISGIINWTSSDLSFRFFKIVFFFSLITLINDYYEYVTGKHTFLLEFKNKFFVTGILLSLFLSVLLYMYNNEPNPFIYFQF
tara:strand:- start:273 stop:1616 length:1344 start_codon:yes stop_codon:yes gene_type:complete